MKRKIALLLLSSVFITCFSQIKVEQSGETKIGLNSEIKVMPSGFTTIGGNVEVKIESSSGKIIVGKNNTATNNIELYPPISSMQTKLYGPVMISGAHYTKTTPSLSFFHHGYDEYSGVIFRHQDGPFSIHACETLNLGIMNKLGGFYMSAYSQNYPDFSFQGRDFYASVNNFTVSCAIKANGVFLTSDEQFKKEIKPINNSLSALKNLNAVSYKLNVTKTLNQVSFGNKKDFEEFKANMPEDNRTHFGFIAQEIEKIYPNLVVTDDSTQNKYVDYIGFIPLLTEAIKELQSQVESQQELIDRLLNEKQGKQSVGQIKTGADTEAAAGNDLIQPKQILPLLEQNIPNPFSQSTQIRYYLPETVTTAYLCIYNIQGTQLKQILLAQRGSGFETISGSQFVPGIYLYALIADGQEVDVKRMILTE